MGCGSKMYGYRKCMRYSLFTANLLVLVSFSAIIAFTDEQFIIIIVIITNYENVCGFLDSKFKVNLLLFSDWRNCCYSYWCSEAS